MGTNVFSDTLKNTVFFGTQCFIGYLFFSFSEGEDFLYYIGWIITIIPLVVCSLTFFTSGIAFITFPLTLHLYFDKVTNKLDKLFLDLASFLGVVFNFGIGLYAYQIIREFGYTSLPLFEPMGISLISNYSN
jgi:hypothetical protein